MFLTDDEELEHGDESESYPIMGVAAEGKHLAAPPASKWRERRSQATKRHRINLIEDDDDVPVLEVDEDPMKLFSTVG